jgi:hypothetical protein
VKIAGVGQAVSEAGVRKALVELYAGVYRKQSIAFKRSKLEVQDKLSLLEWCATEKLELAARVIAAIENPLDIIVQSARPVDV